MLCGNIAQVRAAQQSVEALPLSAEITMHRTEYAERDLGILDLLPLGCSKGHALDDYARSLGLDATQVMAIGDNFNDQAMLEYAGQPVVMGNAGEEMQALAARHDWAITLSNDEDGVAETLEPLIRNAQIRSAQIRRAHQAESAATHTGNPDPEVVMTESGIRSR